MCNCVDAPIFYCFAFAHVYKEWLFFTLIVIMCFSDLNLTMYSMLAQVVIVFIDHPLGNTVI